ncbi:MAG: serine hydrolase [Sterolibacterium sp.]
MKKLLSVLAFVMMLSNHGAGAANEVDVVAKAVSAAQAWLAFTDNGKFTESWDHAASSFQQGIPKDAWAQLSNKVRTPLGARKSREVSDGPSNPALTRAPTGAVVVIQFATSFDNLPAAGETVSLILEPDGLWKVSGYWIKPMAGREVRAAEVAPPGPGAPSHLSDAEIREILRDQIDVGKKGVGVVVGLIDAKGTRVIGYGKMQRDSDTPVDGDSVFEIGSVTKTFTALLLSDMVEKGEVKLDDPVSKYLPNTVKAHRVGNKEITLLNLTRHTSGLPRMPDNFAPKDPSNPFADYSVKDLYAFLNGYQSTREIGAYHEYSNLGVGLLGHALSNRAGTDYETLLRTRVLQPLGMDSTAISLTPRMKSHLASGHQDRIPTASWDNDALAGAGALRSTANDMLKYLGANLGINASPLLPAMQRAHVAAEVSRYSDAKMGLGWFMRRVADTEMIGHNGRTGGYRSFVGLDKGRLRGVVVLSNSNATDVDSIGAHLIDSGYVLVKASPPPTRRAIALDPRVFDAYVGKYQIAPNSTIVISREGERFFAQATGSAKTEIFSDSATHFYTNDADAEGTFVKNQDVVTHMVLLLNGRAAQARKIE